MCIRDRFNGLPYTSVKFLAKNLTDVYGNPLNIRRFDSVRRKQIQELFMLIFNASWAYVTISYDYMPIKKGLNNAD